MLFDSWYISVDNFKLINSLDVMFIAPIKDYCLVSLRKEQGYVRVQDIGWAPRRLTNGVMVRLKEGPFRVWLFKRVSTNREKYQRRKTRSPRNHPGYCCPGWLSLNVHAVEWGLFLHQVRQVVFDKSLTRILQSASIPAHLPT